MSGFCEECVVPLETLSDGDQEFVKSHQPLLPAVAPIRDGQCKLTIITVPVGIDLRVTTDDELIKKVQKNSLLLGLFYGNDLNKAAFETALSGPSQKSPLELTLTPGEYQISVEFTDNTEIPKEAEANTSSIYLIQPFHTLQITPGVTARKVRGLTRVNVSTKTHEVLSLYLLPKCLGLKEALEYYPKDERFHIDKTATRAVLKEKKVSQNDIPLILTALSRGGIAYISVGTEPRTLVQVKADGSLSFPSSQ